LGLIVLAQLLGLPAEWVLLYGIILLVTEFAISPFLMDMTLRWAQGLRWVGLEDLPKGISSTLQRICQEQKIRVPRLGILEDGNPNAFTYGHTPTNARLILTRGILDLLEPEEVETILAHEVGHAKHWDMAIMTAAQLVPLVFYYLYRISKESRSKSESKKSGNGKGESARLLVALGAYLLYVVSQFLVLWLSRTREYFADRFAGEVTRKPNALASALIKIAYGMAGQEPVAQQELAAQKGSVLRRPQGEAVTPLGLFDPKAARTVALETATVHPGIKKMGGEIDRAALKEVMRWDRWNPWAKYYELQSTHPLVANRLQYLGEQAASMGQQPFVLFNLLKPESYWDEFAVDFLLLWLPVLAMGLGAAIGMSTGSPAAVWGGAIAGWGLGMLGQISFQYPQGNFPEMSIVSLLKQVKVSAARPIPCTLKGTIIGRGVPGLIWSEDFVLQDDTGILFLDYQQPLRFWEFFFGLMRGARLQNTPVTATGWFRRSPVPYLEIWTLTDGEKARRCYTRVAKFIGGIVLLIAGVSILF